MTEWLIVILLLVIALAVFFVNSALNAINENLCNFHADFHKLYTNLYVDSQKNRNLDVNIKEILQTLHNIHHTVNKNHS